MPPLPSRLTPDRLKAIRANLKNLSLEDLRAYKEALIFEVLDSLPSSLTPRQREVYAAVLYLGGGSLRQVAEFVRADRGNTYRRLRALIRRGLLRRAHVRGIARYVVAIDDSAQPTTPNNE